MARMQKLDEAVIGALRGGSAIPDAKLEALHAFTAAIVRDRGFLPDEAARRLAAASRRRERSAVGDRDNDEHHRAHDPIGEKP